MPMPTVTLYSRAGCSLCVDAEEDIEAIRKTIPFDFEIVDVDSDASFQTSYGERIPVVTLNGKVISQFYVDSARLRELIKEVKE